MDLKVIVERIMELVKGINGVEPTIQFSYPVPGGYVELYRGLVHYDVDTTRWLRILTNGSELVIESITQRGFDRVEQVIVTDGGVGVHFLERHSDYVKESYEPGDLTPLMRVIYVLVKALLS